MAVLHHSPDSASGGKTAAAVATPCAMETDSSDSSGLSAELDALYQLCCEEEEAAASASATTAVSNLPSFTLSPEDDDDTPEPSPPPASPAVSLPPPLLAHIAHLQSLCVESTSSRVPYEILLCRLLQFLPQPATPLSFRLSVVELLSLLMLPPATTAASCQSFLSSSLYRLVSLLLPPSLLSSSIAAALLRLVDALLASGGPIGRSVCVNVRKYVDGWKEERERRRLKRRADETTAYFAAGGEVTANTNAVRAEVREDEADSGMEGGVIVAGKRRRRIEPDPSIAALFSAYPTADEEDKRATVLIEQLRAEQKVELTERKLRVKDESREEEWKREWRRWMEDEDENDAEEQAEAGSDDVREVRSNRFWRRWEEGTEWRPFLPSSLAESKPRSSRPVSRKEKGESKEASVAEEDEIMPLSAAEQAQVEAAANSRRFSSTFFTAPPIAAPPPSHFVHPSRAAAAFPPAFHPVPVSMPFMPPFEQPLHPGFAPQHAFRGGMR